MSESSEAVLKLPNKSVVFSLWQAQLEASSKAKSLTSAVRERVQTQTEIGSLKRKAYNMGLAAIKEGENNEIAALETIDHAMEYLQWAREFIRSRGHYGDLVKQAEESEKADQSAKPANAMPLDEAQAAFEANAHKAPTPAEVDANAKKKRSLRSIKGGKEDVKAVADKHVAAQEERLGSTDAPPLDDGFDDLEPPKPPLAGATGTGTYTLS